jgi:hypothetical protein
MLPWILLVGLLAAVVLYAVVLNRGRTGDPKAQWLQSLVDRAGEPIPPPRRHV